MRGLDAGGASAIDPCETYSENLRKDVAQQPSNSNTIIEGTPRVTFSSNACYDENLSVINGGSVLDRKTAATMLMVIHVSR